jgi:hypothetical protein
MVSPIENIYRDLTVATVNQVFQHHCHLAPPLFIAHL